MNGEALTVERYVELLSSDYLEGYLSAGGSTIKILIGDDAARSAMLKAAKVAASKRKMSFVSADAKDFRFQNVHDLFHVVAKQINWNALTSKYLRKLLFPRFEVSDDLSIDAIARKNGLENWQVHRAVDEMVQEKLLRRVGLCGEFKRAIYTLITARLSPFSSFATLAPNVIDWFCGRLSSIGLVKPATLYRRISRQNGRHLLESLTRWLRDCGVPGLVVCVDISAITKIGRESHGQRYSRMAAVDSFELIRQFIDSIDQMEGIALIFLAEAGFADHEWRGMSIYPALKMRLTEDVHDSMRVNPFGPMVRLAAANE